MEASRVDRVQVDVGGEIVEISWDERDTLLGKLRSVAGSVAVGAKFEAVGASRPVELDGDERAHLRTVLELWGVSVLPDGLARLLVALVRPIPATSVPGAATDSGSVTPTAIWFAPWLERASTRCCLSTAMTA